MIGPAVVLVACVAAGFGITHLSRLDLELEERVGFGALIGAMCYPALVLGLALGFGLTAFTAVVASALTLGAGAAGLFAGRARLGPELARFRARWREPWPLYALMAVGGAYWLVLMAGAYQTTAGGDLLVWGIGVYSDWAAHLNYAGSFAFGDNFPPQYFIDPGHRMGYPFMVDLFAASLVPLGAGLETGLVLTSGYLGLMFLAVMYLAGRRLVGGAVGPVLGVLVFTLGGGLGFTGFFNDLVRLGWGALAHLPRFYTQDPPANYQWLNPVLAYLLPQRSILYGLAGALAVAALLRIALSAGPPNDRRGFLFAGVLAGLLPAFHVHGFGTALALPAFWALFERRRAWAWFFVPALVLGLPAVLWLVQPGAAGLRFQAGWLAAADGHADNWAWFWIKNTGIFIPLLVIAFAWRGGLDRRTALQLLPTWLWFAVPNLFVFQPWDWDNTKFFVFWYAFGALAVGALLARLGSRGVEGTVAAAALAVVLCLSGLLDVSRMIDRQDDVAQFADGPGLTAAAWVRDNTARDAVVLAAPDHNEPVAGLGGRRLVAGYAGWLWTYGLPDWSERTDNAHRMLAGDPSAPGLVQRYGVSYVVIGPHELNGWNASRAYWLARADLVYSNPEYTIYRVRR